MTRGDPVQTVRRLLDAGYEILAEDGVSRLTFDAVVARAGFSKGAVLYHFKSKAELTQRLLENAIAQFDSHVAVLKGDDVTAGAYTRAYVTATLEHPEEAHRKTRLRVIAELARERGLEVSFGEAVGRWSQQIENDGLDPMTAQIVRLAADGLWWNETTGAEPVRPETRAALRDRLLALARLPRSDLSPRSEVS